MNFFKDAVGGIVGGIGSLFGGALSAHNAEKLQQQNYKAQKEFAQNGIRWKVADAKAAGIHPLYALGASTTSYSPVSGYSGDYGVSEAFNQFGQGISRAVQAKMTKDEREREQARQEMQEVFQLAEFRQRQRESDAKIAMYESEAARNFAASNAVLTQTGLPPKMPSNSGSIMSGQGDARVPKPSVVSNGGYLGPTAPLLTLARTGNTFLDVINPDLADSITESTYRNAVAAVVPEWNVAKGYTKAPIEFLTPEEQDKVKRGELELHRFPGGWSLSVPRMLRHNKRHESKPEWSKKLDTAFFNWFDSLFN